MRIRITLPKEFTFSTEMQVRVNDVNFAGHLGNDRVLSLLHEARTRYLAHFGFSELNVAGVGTIMADAAIVYKSQAFCGDRLTFMVSAANFNRYGCDFLYKIENSSSKREVARAKTGLVFYDYEIKKMMHVPQVFKDKCEISL